MVMAPDRAGRALEVEFLPGLGPIVLDEIGELFNGRAEVPALGSASCSVVVRRDDGRRLLELRTAVAVHLVAHFAVPRPKALLGQQAFSDLVSLLEEAMAWSGRRAFNSFRVNAAGRDSAVFQRLGDEIAAATGLDHDRFGDLLLRVRRAGDGWDVLVRTTPRPLAFRPWREHNVRGALNATIAASMLRLAAVSAGDRYLNLMCGSGTFLAEHLAMDAGRPMGLDNDIEMLAFSRIHAPDAALVHGDATSSPFQPGSFDVLTADLPYGQAVGEHRTNDALYAATLADAARIADVDARFAVITHDIRRFRNALADQRDWRIEREFQVFQKGHNPFVWLLRLEP